MLTDGYQTYAAFADASSKVVHAQCWPHTRRYFEKAAQAEPAAKEALDIIGALYRQEAPIKEKRLSNSKKWILPRDTAYLLSMLSSNRVNNKLSAMTSSDPTQ